MLTVISKMLLAQLADRGMGLTARHCRITLVWNAAAAFAAGLRAFSTVSAGGRGRILR